MRNLAGENTVNKGGGVSKDWGKPTYSETISYIKFNEEKEYI
jgi:hypothetical protein